MQAVGLGFKGPLEVLDRLDGDLHRRRLDLGPRLGWKSIAAGNSGHLGHPDGSGLLFVDLNLKFDSSIKMSFDGSKENILFVYLST